MPNCLAAGHNKLMDQMGMHVTSIRMYISTCARRVFVLGVSRVRVHYKTKKSSPRYEDLDSHASSRRSVVHVRQMYLS